MKAVVEAHRKFPMMNSALDESTQELVVKKYYNFGIATDTDQGLIVPVIKDVDRKSVVDAGRASSRTWPRAPARARWRRRPAGRHLLDHQRRQHRRPVRHPGHQLPRGRDPRRARDQEEPRVVDATARSPSATSCTCRSRSTTASSTAPTGARWMNVIKTLPREPAAAAAREI
jgi:hypothetical protein